MKAVVLLFQFDKERTEKIRRALFPLKIRVKTVGEEEYDRQIGYLAGNKELDGQKGPEPEFMREEGREADFSGEMNSREEITREMLVMAWLTSGQVDQVLTALRRQGLGRIDYKAMVTPYNQYWDCRTLYGELKKEHEAFTAAAGKRNAQEEN